MSWIPPLDVNLVNQPSPTLTGQLMLDGVPITADWLHRVMPGLPRLVAMWRDEADHLGEGESAMRLRLCADELEALLR